eukprot:gnl/Dysnectes_brevis/4398_a5889_439.p1 GENE.gnl/Dysnectes_brevis/4398_a5889_439~~gnl/Dysnectes_brevis/4398_a5889_439.p1  ORF type:complete len:505 (+),score=36.01 gnl/Dysnectes_brevis/4398_a5889_439:913-2427(+)
MSTLDQVLKTQWTDFFTQYTHAPKEEPVFFLQHVKYPVPHFVARFLQYLESYYFKTSPPILVVVDTLQLASSIHYSTSSFTETDMCPEAGEIDTGIVITGPSVPPGIVFSHQAVVVIVAHSVGFPTPPQLPTHSILHAVTHPSAKTVQMLHSLCPKGRSQIALSLPPPLSPLSPLPYLLPHQEDLEDARANVQLQQDDGEGGDAIVRALEGETDSANMYRELIPLCSPDLGDLLGELIRLQAIPTQPALRPLLYRPDSISNDIDMGTIQAALAISSRQASRLPKLCLEARDDDWSGVSRWAQTCVRALVVVEYGCSETVAADLQHLLPGCSSTYVDVVESLPHSWDGLDYDLLVLLDPSPEGRLSTPLSIHQVSLPWGMEMCYDNIDYEGPTSWCCSSPPLNACDSIQTSCGYSKGYRLPRPMTKALRTGMLGRMEVSLDSRDDLEMINDLISCGVILKTIKMSSASIPTLSLLYQGRRITVQIGGSENVAFQRAIGLIINPIS